jgi:hypothetical protein
VRKVQILKPRDLGTALVSGTPAGQSSYLLAMFHRYRKVWKRLSWIYKLTVRNSTSLSAILTIISLIFLLDVVIMTSRRAIPRMKENWRLRSIQLLVKAYMA